MRKSIPILLLVVLSSYLVWSLENGRDILCPRCMQRKEVNVSMIEHPEWRKCGNCGKWYPVGKITQ